MTDPKEDYYFNEVPQLEAANPHINWTVYRTLLNVVLTYSALDSRLARFLSRWDLFPSAFNLLTILSRAGEEGIHLSRISELLAVSRANVTGLVDVLARKGLVTRVSNPADRRVRLAQLTEKGRLLIQEILPQYYQFNAGLCSDIPEADTESLHKTLTHLRDKICEDNNCSIPAAMTAEEEGTKDN